MNRNKQFAVLGLGIFGSTVAKTLAKYDCEVIAVDSDIKCVERVVDDVTSAMMLDITDLEALRSSGIGECDVAIVGLGSHLEESILAIINLKELGVPYIIAKAKNKRYMQIMYSVGANKVIRPEKEMGEQIAKQVLSKNIIDLICVDEDYSIVELRAPYSWYGKSLIELDLRNKYGINIIAIRQRNEKTLNFSPEANYLLQEDDNLLIISDDDTVKKINSIK